MTTYKRSPRIVRFTKYVCVFSIEVRNLNFYVNSLDLSNLASNLLKHTYCGQNKMQLEEGEAHELLVPISHPDVVQFLLSEIQSRLPVLKPDSQGPSGHAAFPRLSFSISHLQKINCQPIPGSWSL